MADERTEYHVPYNPTDKNEICTSDTIKNNYIDHVTTEIQGACGIAAGYPAHLTIEHNEVSHDELHRDLRRISAGRRRSTR